MTRCTVDLMSFNRRASKQEALNGIENGEQMFVVYNQRMLIAVLNSARVFDPGGQDKKMEKVNQNILVQQ